jgi:hypothetical protein
MNGARDMLPTPLVQSGNEALGHQLVNIVIVAILDARTDTAGLRGPEAVSDPALAEGGHPRARFVRGIAGVEGVREIEVLDLDRVAGGGYPREHVPVLAHGREGGVVLDPAQHVRYTGGVHRVHSLWSGLRGVPPPPGPSLYPTPLLYNIVLYLSIDCGNIL